MRRYEISAPTGLSALSLVERPSIAPGLGEVKVEMRAWSLNYRDLSMPKGGYIGNSKVSSNPPLVPLSDGAGVVVAVGPNVTRFKVGDNVATCFFQTWLDGPISAEYMPSALGGAIDGVLAEEVVLNQDGLVHIPKGYDYVQAACLPCAALTAWEALQEAQTKAGDHILTLGTGGVSLFALQFAKALGAKVSITSSSDEKLVRCKALGADNTINYQKTPKWDIEVINRTAGQGVDHVIELGGAGTFERSLNAARIGGTVSLIGVLTGVPEQNPSPMMILFKRLRVQGIYVGSRARFEEMNAFINAQGIKPIIDCSFSFEKVVDAYEHLRSGSHFGKVVIER